MSHSSTSSQPLVLFIDTNVFLSFYHMTSDELEELKKLTVLVRSKKVILLVPEQVEDEYRRNRAPKIADAMSRLSDQKLKLQFPQMCRGYPEYDVLRKHQKAYEKALSALTEKLGKAIEERELPADEVIADLLRLGQHVKMTDEILTAARLRMDLGNPPGKSKSLGDAIIWEAILSEAKSREDLFFVSDDRDYFAALNPEHFNEFLLESWGKAKRSSLHFYKRLSDFFRDKFPDIRLASEYEKDLRIEELASSSNFSQTHGAVRRLSTYSDFSVAQAEAIVNTVIANNQVHWILGDDDVREFVDSVAQRYGDSIDPAVMDQLSALLEEAAAESAQKVDEDGDP